MKFGQIPTFGPPISKRVLNLVEQDRTLFQQGFRAEMAGFGIGCFAYYRQLVERQREHLIGEIKSAAERLGTDPQALADFDRAMQEPDFGRVADLLARAMPQSLRIDGHNPLKLLYKALSTGLHDGAADAECLEAARTIRLVLTEVVDRIAELRRERTELSAAVGRLTRP